VTIPLSPVAWRPCWRIIPSRYPPIDLYERVADAADLDAVFAIEAMTNPRLRDAVGDLALVQPEDRVSGPGTSAIMAAFTHLNPGGSRFTDGTFGVFYTAHDLDTAVAETRHHRERFMRATRQARAELDMRVYLVDLVAMLHDLRGLREAYPLIYHPDDYGAGQHLAVTLRRESADGIVFDSVRLYGGHCAAVFRPRLLSNCRQERHLCYVWDGTAISKIYEKRAYSGS
jgi:hypothetical protein